MPGTMLTVVNTTLVRKDMALFHCLCNLINSLLKQNILFSVSFRKGYRSLSALILQSHRRRRAVAVSGIFIIYASRASEPRRASAAPRTAACRRPCPGPASPPCFSCISHASFLTTFMLMPTWPRLRISTSSQPAAFREDERSARMFRR